MSASFLIILPVLLPLLAALALVPFRGSPAAQRRGLAAASGLLLAASLALLSAVSRADAPLALHLGGWAPPAGINFHADLLAALMIAVSALVGFTGALFASGEIGRLLWRQGYACFYLILFAAINGAFLTGDLFNLFVWFEVMLMASFAMLVLGRRRHTYEGAAKYVVLNVFSSFFFLSGLGILHGKVGSLNLADLSAKLAAQSSDPLILSSAALLLVAFGIKAGVFPLYFWLPPAYPNTGFTTAAVFGGLLTKVGVYALFRVFGGAFAALEGFTGGLFLAIGGATMVAGVLGAASQHHVRRILSFHIISQIGYMIAGLGLFTAGGFAAAIFYIVHHILVKANLFFAAGLIARTGRSEELSRLGGLASARPLLAVLFLIPALSLGGIPPLSGFFAKFFLLREMFQAQAWLIAAVALGTGALTLYSMTKIWGQAFWKDSPRRTGLISSPRRQFLPVAMLAAATVAIGLMPGPLMRISERAASQLLAPLPTAAADVTAGASSSGGFPPLPVLSYTPRPDAP